MSVVYFSEKALENIIARQDIPKHQCYDLVLRKNCCKNIYFPKSKSSYCDHLMGGWEAFDVDNLPDNLQGEHVHLDDNIQFVSIFKDLAPNIDFIDDVKNYKKQNSNDDVKLFIVDDLEKELIHNLISEGYKVETIGSLIAKDLTTITGEGNESSGNWTWVKNKIDSANKRLIWIDRYLMNNITHQHLTRNFKGALLLEDKDDMIIDTEKIEEFIRDIKEIEFKDIESCIEKGEEKLDNGSLKLNWRWKGSIKLNSLKKHYCSLRYTKEQKERIINTLLIQEAKCILSYRIFPTFFKNIKSAEVFKIDVFYSDDSKLGKGGQYRREMSTEDLREMSRKEKILKEAFKEMFKEFNIKSDVEVCNMDWEQHKFFKDRYIITNNYTVKAKTETLSNLALSTDIRISNIHFQKDSSYRVLCGKVGIDL